AASVARPPAKPKTKPPPASTIASPLPPPKAPASLPPLPAPTAAPLPPPAQVHAGAPRPRYVAQAPPHHRNAQHTKSHPHHGKHHAKGVKRRYDWRAAYRRQQQQG